MKKFKMSGPIKALIITSVLMLASMFGYSLVKTNGYSVKETNYCMTLTSLQTKMKENLEENKKDVDILFDANDTYKFSFTTYVPKNATKDNPAPAVIGAHGYNNSKEMQLSNFTELAKRGFVVVVPDLAGHGRSDVEIGDYTKGSEGVVAAVNYAMTMDEVDNTKIGVTGHSAGNLDCINAIKAINVDGAKNRVSSFFCPCGTISALFAGGQKNLILGVAAGKYDELDTHYFNSNTFLSGPLASVIVKNVYPSFNETTVKEGQWYTPEGPVQSPSDGNSLGVSSAVAIWNPSITHVGGTFSTIATKLTVEFFYAAYGTPTGMTYLSGTSQTWWIASAFQILGLLCFFSLAITLVACLFEIKKVSHGMAFSPRIENNVVFDDLVEQRRCRSDSALAIGTSVKKSISAPTELPSIKSWKEYVPFLVTFIPLILFPFFTYYPCYDAATRLFSSAYSCPNVNGIALFTLVCGLFSFLMLFVNWIARKLCHLHDGTQVMNPFSFAKVSGFKQLALIFLFSLLVVALMYVPNYIAYKGFGMNFQASVYAAGLPRYEWIPAILFRYLPFWLVFMISNSLLNAGCRFKEIPEWGSTLFIAIANLLPFLLLITINYSTLTSTGQTYYTFCDPSIMIWNLLAPQIFIAVVGRYLYKKTGNIWTGTFVCALVLTIMAVTITRHTSSFMFM